MIKLKELLAKDLLTEAENAMWSKDELALIKKMKIKVDGGNHSYKPTTGRNADVSAKFDTKNTWGTIDKYLYKGKTSYSGYFSWYQGGGMGWNGKEIRPSKNFDEEQNLKLLAMMFKKLQTMAKKYWG